MQTLKTSEFESLCKCACKQVVVAKWQESCVFTLESDPYEHFPTLLIPNNKMDGCLFPYEMTQITVKQNCSLSDLRPQ